MSVTIDDGIKRRMAKRKSALVIEIIEGARSRWPGGNRSFELSPSGIERWLYNAKRGMDFDGDRGPGGAA